MLQPKVNVYASFSLNRSPRTAKLCRRVVQQRKNLVMRNNLQNEAQLVYFCIE